MLIETATAVIYSRYASRLIWQQRLDGEPLVVGQFVAHEVKLHFKGLKSFSAISDDSLKRGSESGFRRKADNPQSGANVC